MNSFCTIITKDYIPFAKAIQKSLEAFNFDFSFQVLIVDSNKIDYVEDNIDFTFLKDLKETFPEDFSNVSKYMQDPANTLRWSLKPLYLKYLMGVDDIDKVIYVDPDIYFYNNPKFLFGLLENNDVIITPHWRSKNPFVDSINFDQLFSGGIYNAGFFGCNKEAIPILDWWLELCSYKMEKGGGFYVDQAYLNLMPVYYPSQVKVIDHKGCNVAGWNLYECKRIQKDDEILINEKYPIIFVHFTPGTVNAIQLGRDPLLLPYLNECERQIKVYKPDFSFSGASSQLNPKRKGLMEFFRKTNP